MQPKCAANACAYPKLVLTWQSLRLARPVEIAGYLHLPRLSCGFAESNLLASRSFSPPQ